MRFIIVETSDTQFQFDDLDSAMNWIDTLCRNRVRFTVKHFNGVKEGAFDLMARRSGEAKKRAELKRAA